jgi:hypothetical protein
MQWLKEKQRNSGLPEEKGNLVYHNLVSSPKIYYFIPKAREDIS